MRRVVALIQWVLALALVLGIARLDQQLSEDRTIGPERNAVRGALDRIATAPEAKGLILLGSSTSADWIPFHWLAGSFDEPRSEVIDAHVNGCHQGCTWAEVRRLLAQERHFRVAIFGTNQFQMCEREHSKRVLQHRRLAPEGDALPDLTAYLHAERSLRWIARYGLGAASGAYADAAAIQKALGEPILGNAWLRREMNFVRPSSGRAPRIFCPYSDAEVAYKRELSRRLYADLTRLADETFVMLLPDRTLAEDDPEVHAAWERHRQLQRELVAEHPSIHLLDLTLGMDYVDEDFGDAVHLVAVRRGRQRDRFIELLRDARDASSRGR